MFFSWHHNSCVRVCVFVGLTSLPLSGPPALVFAGAADVNGSFVIALGDTVGNALQIHVWTLQTYINQVNTVNDTSWRLLTSGAAFVSACLA